jgi:hypothetical protein
MLLLFWMRLLVLRWSHLATVLVYIHGSRIQEKPIGFTDIVLTEVLISLLIHGQNLVSDLNLGSKLVVETHNGVSVMGGHLNCLLHKTELCACAVLVLFYAHVLYLVLSQSRNSINKCSLFLLLKCDCYLYITFNQQNLCLNRI